MPDRTIRRIAFLQEYSNRPLTLKEIIPEVAAKGYTAAAFAARIGRELFAELAEEAERFGLEAMAFTGFMKYQEAYLKDHPDQRMILNTDEHAKDQDKLDINWGCPFNPAFQQRHLDFLRTLGRIPNLTEVWINDEALLGLQSDQLGCYCKVCREAWRGEFGGDIPMPPFADPETKRQFILWRIRRWNDVHAMMKSVLNEHHNVRAVHLTTPSCCTSINPWVTAVDLASMVEGIDGIMTDPYYTFHEIDFRPQEVYLSECCRILRGLCGPGKKAEICAQGFSMATFNRPLDERDGWWAGIVPAALGLDGITAFTYLLQQISPMLETYEKSFSLDEYFSQTAPADFVGIVNSLETQCFDIDSDSGTDSWLWSRMFTLGAVARHNALPYGYLPSSRLTEDDLRRFPVVILPNVSCLSVAARDSLRDYVRSGGVLVACGETATRDETGKPLDDTFLQDIFGVKSLTPLESSAQFAPVGDHPALASLPWPDETTAEFWGGVHRPAMGLDYIVRVDPGDEAEILAAFAEDSSAANHPAVMTRSLGEGTAIFLAGIPTRNYYRPEFRMAVLNLAGRALGRLILDTAEDKLPIRVKGFPPVVPMNLIRPIDPRLMPTAEFMPCIGEDLYLAVVTSYFKEPMQFQIEVEPPAGKKCVKIRELIGDQPIEDFKKISGNRIEIDVNFSFDDCVRIFAFFLGDS
ncbi:MAG: beta-galactosidase trimerization domain-containing protein [Phycisphaerae bacterium]|nr:beta-galactosidase trimerization domain-containing protein [Phycisphaerae bacterium]